MARSWTVLGAALLMLTTGCVAIGLPDPVTVKASDIPGAWKAACGETMVLRADGTGTATGFPLMNGQRSHASDARWRLEPMDVPTLAVEIVGDAFRDMPFKRQKGQLRLVNEADGATCIFVRG